MDFEVYKTDMGYYIILENESQLLEAINQLGNDFTIGLSPTFPKKNEICIFINSHNVCMDDRVGEFVIKSLGQKFNPKKFSKCKKTDIKFVGVYW